MRVWSIFHQTPLAALHIGHSGIGSLDGVVVNDLPELVVEEGKELLSDVDGD